MDRDLNTRILGDRDEGPSLAARQALLAIYQALGEKGYDPIQQITNFLLTGEPTYITAHKNARSIAQKLERDEILEELLQYYLSNLVENPSEASEA